MSETEELDKWLSLVAKELDCSAEGINTQALLDVARDVAHNQIRPGAPTSTFYVGYALGMWEQQKGAEGSPPTAEEKDAKLEELSQRIQKLALES